MKKQVTDIHHPGRAGVVLSAGDLQHFAWLRTLLPKAGAELVEVRDMAVDDLLKWFPPKDLQLIVLQKEARAGMNQLQFIAEQVGAIRERIPGIGILVPGWLGEHPVNGRLLPARVWMVNEQTSPEALRVMMEDSREAKRDLNRNLRYLGKYTINKVGRMVEQVPFALPNFNLKSLSMLPSIARAAQRAGSPCYVEISAQEALIYYGMSGVSPKRRVAAAFSAIREAVDHVNKVMNTKIYVHLDHCSDPDLIHLSLDAGFDSIMADRSTSTLGDNIRFVKDVKKIADAYGVTTEGEVGAIDHEGLYKRTTSLPAEVMTFVQETGVDFVGVNAGQFHSGDYNYDISLSALRQYQDERLRNAGRDANLLAACASIDAMLAERGMERDFELRGEFSKLIETIIYSEGADYEQLLNDMEARSSVSRLHWMKELRRQWQVANQQSAERMSALYGQVVKGAVKHDAKDNVALDFELLAKLAGALAGGPTRMVLHGGSSIDEQDYRWLNTFQVARVNLGSTPHLQLLEALRSSKAGAYNYQYDALPNQNEGIVTFMDDHGADWKAWLEEYPLYLQNFELQLYHRYFVPLANG